MDGAHDVPRGHLGRGWVHRYPFTFQEELVEPAKLRQVPQRAGGLWAVLLAGFGRWLPVIIQFAIGAAESIDLYKVRLLQLRLVTEELKLAAHHDALSAGQHPQLQQPDVVEIDAFGRPDGELDDYRQPAAESGKKHRPKATGSLRNLSQFGRLDQLLLEREWIPVYPATSKVTSWYIMGAIHYVLSKTPPIEEPLDYQMIISLDKAVREIHEPGEAGPYRAIQRLKYNEALSIGLVMALRQRDAEARTASTMPATLGGYREELLSHLPFDLTEGQRRIIGSGRARSSSISLMTRRCPSVRSMGRWLSNSSR